MCTATIRGMDDLRRIDLNLLLALHALLEERHVTRAALRLHRSQPAVSHALAQLRAHFDDPLLIRKGGHMELTSRALVLATPLQEALTALNGLLSDRPFRPDEATGRFRVAMSDYATRIFLPGLVRTVREQAPGIDLAISQGSREAMLAQLADGELDLAFGVFPKPPEGIRTQDLFGERFVSVADVDRLPRGSTLTFKAWIERPHVMVALRPDAKDEIEQALAAQGITRRIAVALPHWTLAAQLVPHTDLVLTVASRAMGPMNEHPRLRAFAPPMEIDSLKYQQAWHVRRDSDPALHWLRESVIGQFR